MPETRRVKPLNLTTAQARRLLDSGKLLVVEALQTQCVTRRWRTGWLYPCVEPEDQRWGVENMMTDETIESPYQPGDVVPCTERWSNRQSAPGASSSAVRLNANTSTSPVPESTASLTRGD